MYFAVADPLAALLPELIASLVIGGSVFVVARTITNTLHTEDLEQDAAWRYDVNRINELRWADLFYRAFQPLIQLLARGNRILFREYLPEINREIQVAGLPRFWTAEEYLGKVEIIAALVAPLYIYFCVQIMGGAGVVTAIVATVMTGWLLRRRLAARARYRLLRIKRRLPFLLDLLTLLMEAGATFLQALDDAVEQFGDHPVGQEFGRMLSEINMGKGRTEALEAMRDRLDDDEITSIVGSIIQGEELGTPLARLFRTQADVLRIKRTQRAETVAGEAGVKMLLPAIMVMASTVLIILGPFVLGFIYAEFM
ncbi:MAG TPA: type II secretion system F family protein [Planctomycetaceae bacterium]|nr:type II secretion system F family protein [Planctomycetaceae bacterium]